MWILFKALKTNCNRFRETNWIRKSWFKTTNYFISKLKEDNGATMFSIIEKSEETIFNKILWVSYKTEAQKIINLLNDTSNVKSKFATKKCYVRDGQLAKK